ncbi:MAG: primase-helicase zinc-binding domain-containing protein [Pseudorhizobium pelagicum]|uniref:primase-helicase zinc-binding domain-containing protein n=1 Tax=Pseudorhizobium pelagicum TaxID=1509405 RepID=UPI00345FCF32
MSDVISDFIRRAQLLPVSVGVSRLGLTLPRKDDQGGPCPRCGGKDRFAVSRAKEKWNCRHCGTGGGNALGLIGHVCGYDLHRRSDLLEASSIALGEAVPDGGERETDAERAAREARMRDLLDQAEREADESRRKQEGFRELEVKRARGIYLYSIMAPHPEDATLRDYLRLRTGHAMPDAVFESIRFNPRLTFWSDKRDERGHQLELYVGYAMIVPFVDLSGHVTGCHQTWIDLGNAPKFRPEILDDNGETLPTKKMRGTKKGSIIPICGDLSARRWLGGEGIETTAAVAGFEGFRADTFYFATGDLGNMAGPADPKSAFDHPTLVKTDSRGRSRPVRVAGPVPKPDQSPADAYQPPDHVDEVVHLADGDSEFVFTAAALERASRRLARPGRVIRAWWPPEGMDFAEALAGAKSGKGGDRT